MADVTEVSIGQVKRDISELVNRVAYGGERIVLTSRGKPKAALVSLEDYKLLTLSRKVSDDEWQAWVNKRDQLLNDIRKRRKGVPLDVTAALEAARADLEERDASRS